MSAIKIDKKIEMNEFEIVKFQLFTHCFVSDIRLSDTELNILTFLGMQGEIKLSDFCKLATENGYLGSDIAVNSCLHKFERTKLFLKRGKWKKVIFLNPELKVHNKGTIVLDYRIIKKDDSEKMARVS